MSPLDTFTFNWLGDTFLAVLLFNFILIGPASFAAGHTVANNWRPWNRIIFYSALLSAGLRFLDYALADGELWSVGGFVLGLVVQFAIAALAWRLTRSSQMVSQYPWLYRRKGLLGWEERH